ncbi:MAG: ATP-binding protein [Pseudomonadota bacterium]
MYHRTLKKTLEKVSQAFPVLLLTGPRQVGKTTLLELCADDNRTYVTLDDLDARNLAKNDPALFLQNYPLPIIIDEVQYAPELMSYIKIAVDKDKRNGLFWLTGSQKFNLMSGITESLAGRVAILDLLGLSHAETEGRGENNIPFLPTEVWLNHIKPTLTKSKNMIDMYQHIWLGSFPKLHENGEDIRDIFYRSYIQTYIQRDVKDILKISSDIDFMRFLTAIAARTGQMVNYADLSRDVGVDNKTIKSWMSVLETSGLIYLLKPYYNNLSKRLIKNSKIYFLDTGLCSYLTKWPDAQSLANGAMSGAILETYIFSEILKSYWHQGKEAHFHYYRDADQKEIDLLIETGDTLYPVEFKRTGTPSLHATKHFSVLKKLGKHIGTGAVICFVEKDIFLSETVRAIPAGYI